MVHTQVCDLRYRSSLFSRVLMLHHCVIFDMSCLFLRIGWILKCKAGWKCASKVQREYKAQEGNSDLVAVHWAQWGGQCFGRGSQELQHLLTCALGEDQRVNTDILLPCINSSTETDTEGGGGRSTSDWDINYINQTVWNMTILIMSRQSVSAERRMRTWQRESIAKRLMSCHIMAMIYPGHFSDI